MPKSFPSPKAHRAALISVSLALNQTPVYTARSWIRGIHASRGVPVYVPAFAGTHCAYARRDGQAELTWVAAFSILDSENVGLTCLEQYNITNGIYAV